MARSITWRPAGGLYSDSGIALMQEAERANKTDDKKRITLVTTVFHPHSLFMFRANTDKPVSTTEIQPPVGGEAPSTQVDHFSCAAQRQKVTLMPDPDTLYHHSQWLLSFLTGWCNTAPT